jgi:hypothetical protein
VQESTSAVRSTKDLNEIPKTVAHLRNPLAVAVKDQNRGRGSHEQARAEEDRTADCGNPQLKFFRKSH